MLSSRNRHRLFRAGFSAVSLAGADRWLAPATRGRGLILTFHHVRPAAPAAYAPNSLLAITPDFLDRTLTLLRARGFELIGLDAVPERLSGRATQAPFAVLTFDDGYRDNLQFAAPILARHGAPWTLFVASDFAEGRGRLWWIELERAIAALDRVALSPEQTGGLALDLLAGDAAQKSAAFDAVYRALRSAPEERLLATIAALCERAGFAPGKVAEELCLSWDELRALAANPAVTIGAHTVSHPMLAKHDETFARREVAESRARIAASLGRDIRHLSFPVGDPTSAGPREFAIARELGFATAVTTRPGHLFADHAGHLHALPRVSINGLHQTDAALASLISGVPFLVWNRGRRINVG
ncbi:polysaccharide deacetylase family protein [Methylobacterium sp. C25]|uniref:polysaccharide deacetylase family protein n=1 Tax=Methylobacterium sp. C25 TaxID=2721622 RepID=UPI001F3AAD7D|nr:polysaccharide deacetylase family protein [Methylobacterium sp. C25]MCE4223528.1 polysaccharide deacetylase family protein [Methylobacterium sp. C25]